MALKTISIRLLIFTYMNMRVSPGKCTKHTIELIAGAATIDSMRSSTLTRHCMRYIYFPVQSTGTKTRTLRIKDEDLADLCYLGP